MSAPRPLLRGSIFATCAAFGLLTHAACDPWPDECEPDENHCEGNVRHVCVEGEDVHNRWGKEDCGPNRTCVEAVCAKLGVPDCPELEATECSGDDLYQCMQLRDGRRTWVALPCWGRCEPHPELWTPSLRAECTY